MFISFLLLKCSGKFWTIWGCPALPEWLLNLWWLQGEWLLNLLSLTTDIPHYSYWGRICSSSLLSLKVPPKPSFASANCLETIDCLLQATGFLSLSRLSNWRPEENPPTVSVSNNGQQWQYTVSGAFLGEFLAPVPLLIIKLNFSDFLGMLKACWLQKTLSRCCLLFLDLLTCILLMISTWKNPLYHWKQKFFNS